MRNFLVVINVITLLFGLFLYLIFYENIKIYSDEFVGILVYLIMPTFVFIIGLIGTSLNIKILKNTDIFTFIYELQQPLIEVMLFFLIPTLFIMFGLLGFLSGVVFGFSYIGVLLLLAANLGLNEEVWLENLKRAGRDPNGRILDTEVHSYCVMYGTGIFLTVGLIAGILKEVIAWLL